MSQKLEPVLPGGVLSLTRAPWVCVGVGEGDQSTSKHFRTELAVQGWTGPPPGAPGFVMGGGCGNQRVVVSQMDVVPVLYFAFL